MTILDEAYVDFAPEHAMSLALKHPQVIVSRTFSKAYSLCFQRIGYFVGHPELIEALDKIRDSYNVNGLGQAAACATLDDLLSSYQPSQLQEGHRHSPRERLAGELAILGFVVLPSATNFPAGSAAASFPASQWLEKHREPEKSWSAGSATRMSTITSGSRSARMPRRTL